VNKETRGPTTRFCLGFNSLSAVRRGRRTFFTESISYGGDPGLAFAKPGEISEGRGPFSSSLSSEEPGVAPNGVPSQL